MVESKCVESKSTIRFVGALDEEAVDVEAVAAKTVFANMQNKAVKANISVFFIFLFVFYIY